MEKIFSRGYPHEILKGSLGELALLICGVEHKPKFFYEHEDFYDKLVQNSIAVVTEDYPSAPDGKVSPAFQQFFNGIERLCEKHGKNIFNVDPHNIYSQDGIISSLLDILLGTLGICMMIGGVKWISKNKKVSRRGFLKGLFTAGVGLNLLQSSEFGSEFKYVISEETFWEYGNDDLFGYGLLDFRNLKIAKGLELIPSMLDEDEVGDYILALHGAGHTDHISYYLERPDIRSLKELAYEPIYGVLDDKFVHKYVNKGGIWIEVARKKY